MMVADGTMNLVCRAEGKTSMIFGYISQLINEL